MSGFAETVIFFGNEIAKWAKLLIALNVQSARSSQVVTIKMQMLVYPSRMMGMVMEA